MLKRGTAKRNRQEIEDALARLRSKVEVEGGEASFTVVGETTRAQLGEVLALVAEILCEPTFPAPEFEQLRREFAAALDESRADPESIAQRELARLGNPYPKGDVRHQPTLDEEIALFANAKLDDVRAFHAKFAGGAAAEIAVVGDFDPESVGAALEKLFGTWTAPAPYTRVPEPLVAKPARVLTLDAPDKANASLEGVLALPISDASPDYAAVLVASHVLGDTGSGRLWTRIRERDGLSYSVGAALAPSSFEANSPLLVSATFAPGNRERLAKALAEELTRLVRDGATDAEVAEAKAAILKLRQLSRTQDASLAGALVRQAHLGRDFAYSGKVDAAIEGTRDRRRQRGASQVREAGRVRLAYAGTFGK